MSPFGNLGAPAGTTYDSRAALRAAGLHRHLMRGIAGRPTEGADAIVMSGGYDDIDLGDEIVYTGEGGQDDNRNPIADQELIGGNAALITSELEGLPVRVIRGAELHSPFAPPAGYRYDGLFYVENHCVALGRQAAELHDLAARVKRREHLAPDRRRDLADPRVVNHLVILGG